MDTPAVERVINQSELFLGLIFLVLSVALFAIRPVSKEERDVGFLLEQFLHGYFIPFFRKQVRSLLYIDPGSTNGLPFCVS